MNTARLNFRTRSAVGGSTGEGKSGNKIAVGRVNDL
jgi:hypothetical protein